jgi:hypothetical protein
VVTFEGGEVAISGNQIDEAVIRDVVIRNTQDAAIVLQDSGNVTLFRTEIQNPGDVGVDVRNGAGIVMNQSSVTGSFGPAVRMEQINAGLIINSTFKNVGGPTADAPDGNPVAAIELINVKDFGIVDSRISKATRGVDVEGVTGVFSLATNNIDLSAPLAGIPTGSSSNAIEIDGIGANALISLTSNTVKVNRLAGQSVLALNLESSFAPPAADVYQGIVQIANNEFVNLSGQGIAVTSSVPALLTLSGNTFDYPQLGLPDGLPSGSPGPFFITATDSTMRLDLSENTVTAGLGTVIHQPMQSSIRVFDGNLTLDLTGNTIPIESLSLFRDAESSLVIEENSENSFPLKTAPGSAPIPGVN